MVICSAYGCSNRSDRNPKPGVSFHKFPKQNVLRERWVAAVRRSNWTPSVSSALCSQHFSEKYLNRTYASGRTELKENAVPTLFPSYPPHLQRRIAKLNELPLPCAAELIKMTSAKPTTTASTVTSPTSSDEPIQSTLSVPLERNNRNEKTTEVLGPSVDVGVQMYGEDIITMNALAIRNKRLEWKVNVLKKLVLEKSATIKKLKQQNLRLHGRVFDLKYLVEDMKLNNLVDISDTSAV